LTEKDER